MADADVLAEQIRAMQGDVSEIKATMRDVADALIKLARLEERHTTVADGLGRAFSAIKGLENRIRLLESAQPVQKLTSSWTLDVVKYLVGGVVGVFILKVIGG